MWRLECCGKAFSQHVRKMFDNAVAKLEAKGEGKTEECRNSEGEDNI